MPTNPALLALKAEIQNDPTGAGYADHSHEEIAKMIREKAGQVDATSLTGGMIAASLVIAEVVAMTAAEQKLLALYVSAGEMPVTAALKQALGGMFPAGSATRQNLIGLMKRQGSRAEEIGIPTPNASDVANALLRT